MSVCGREYVCVCPCTRVSVCACGVLTDDVDDLVVDVERDEGDGQEAEVELQHRRDRVDVVVARRADVRQLPV